MKKTNLEVKVLALNTLNEYAEQIYNYEKKHFSQFLGKDIFKVDGSLKQKYEHPKLEFNGQMADGTFYSVSYWFTSAYNHFDVNIKICINGGSYDVKPTTAFCQYEETRPTLFEIEKTGELKETTQQPNDYSVRYDVASLEAKAAQIKAAAEQYRKASESLPYQFKDVLYIERLTRS